MSEKKRKGKRATSAPLFEELAGLEERFPALAIELRAETLTVSDNVRLGIAQVIECLESRRWSRSPQENLLRSWLIQRDRSDLQAETLCQWIRFHAVDDWEAVTDCIELIPPAEVSIIGRLQKRGSQKVVYKANWRVQQRTVILKRLLDKSILHRELRSHPLSANHPNIVKTYTAGNSLGEMFLIEELLDDVLNDTFRTTGLEETARLTHDIAAALDYIHQLTLVHGDVKPDNIGKHEGRFVLLDFGICRPANQFTPEASATGSLRTRAPELLVGDKAHSIQSDLWALGAVVASVVCGRFPLVESDEHVPPITKPVERQHFEDLLRERVVTSYDSRIVAILEDSHDQRQTSILAKLLSRQPSDRGSPVEILEQVRAEFSYALPQPSAPAAWGGNPAEELEVLRATWPTLDAVMRLPPHRLRTLISRLEDLRGRLETGPGEPVEKLDALLSAAKRAQRAA